MDTSPVVIDSRFNGPPGSGNGGYSCGAIAASIGEPVEVTLRLPPPLETPLTIVADGATWRVLDGDRLVAEVAPSDRLPMPPASPSLEQAEAAMQAYLGHTHHEFPTCFTCGPERSDGLGIFSGPIDGMVASLWVPDASLPIDIEGGVAEPIVWAALDCPGAWTAMRADTDAPVVLGRMAAHIERVPQIGEALVSYGWRTGGEGRKAYAGTALADATGDPIAWAKQVWVEVRSR